LLLLLLLLCVVVCITWVVTAMMRARVLGGGDQPREDIRFAKGVTTLSCTIYLQLRAADSNTAEADSCWRYKILADLCKRRVGIG
jgi:hypothetical protein